jgi:hypothetical protein
MICPANARLRRLKPLKSIAFLLCLAATGCGTILTQSIAPLTYDSASGQTASYLVTITAKVVLTARDGRVLYQNDAVPFHEQYQSTQDLNGFIQEDGPAVRRLAQDFAHTIVSNMLESF